jgi:hypothetical protein
MNEIQLTRKQLQKELKNMRDSAMYHRKLADSMMLENEKLRTRISELNELHLRSQGYKIRLNSIPEMAERLELRIELDRMVFNHYRASSYADEVAAMIAYEIKKVWPRTSISGLDINQSGRFTP